MPGAEWPRVCFSTVVCASGSNSHRKKPRLWTLPVWFGLQISKVFAFFQKHITHLGSQDVLQMQSNRGFESGRFAPVSDFPDLLCLV